jgi:hypothetical protein
MLRNRLLEKLHQLSGIDIFQGTEFSAFPGSVILVHIELGGIARTVTFYHRHISAALSRPRQARRDTSASRQLRVSAKPIVV